MSIASIRVNKQILLKMFSNVCFFLDICFSKAGNRYDLFGLLDKANLEKTHLIYLSV